MSRCYPYPPPGYQKKATAPDVNAPKVVLKDKDKKKEKEKKPRDPGKEKKSKDSEKKEKSKDSEKEKKGKDSSQKEKKDKEKSKDKEKRDKDKRDKDRKDKRKKDSETNGVAHDKDPRSSKLQRTSLANNVPYINEGNGKVSEVSTSAAINQPLERDGRDAAKVSTSAAVKQPLERDGRDAAKVSTSAAVKQPLERDGRDAAKVSTSAAVKQPPERDGRDAAKLSTSTAVKQPLDRDGRDAAKVSTSAAVKQPLERDGRDAAKLCGSTEGPGIHPPSVYIKKDQPNGKVDPTVPPLVLLKPVGGSPLDGETAPSGRPSNHNHHIESNNLGSQRPQKLPDFSICDMLLQHVPTWSTLDDEDWLCPSRERVHPKPKAQVGEDTSQQVWAEAVYLPSVDMYALPYVVPY